MKLFLLKAGVGYEINKTILQTFFLHSKIGRSVVELRRLVLELICPWWPTWSKEIWKCWEILEVQPEVSLISEGVLYKLEFFVKIKDTLVRPLTWWVSCFPCEYCHGVGVGIKANPVVAIKQDPSVSLQYWPGYGEISKEIIFIAVMLWTL